MRQHTVIQSGTGPMHAAGAGCRRSSTGEPQQASDHKHTDRRRHAGDGQVNDARAAGEHGHNAQEQWPRAQVLYTTGKESNASLHMAERLTGKKGRARKQLRGRMKLPCRHWQHASRKKQRQQP